MRSSPPWARDPSSHRTNASAATGEKRGVYFHFHRVICCGVRGGETARRFTTGGSQSAPAESQKSKGKGLRDSGTGRQTKQETRKNYFLICTYLHLLPVACNSFFLPPLSLVLWLSGSARIPVGGRLHFFDEHFLRLFEFSLRCHQSNIFSGALTGNAEMCLRWKEQQPLLCSYSSLRVLIRHISEERRDPFATLRV